jgi:hypothetical protein
VKKRLILSVVAVALVLCAAVFGVRNNGAVSVRFLCYTNCDTRGINDQYTWAWFRIENHSGAWLSISQGPLLFKGLDGWQVDTNRVGHPYEATIEPGGNLILSLMPPQGASFWRSSFVVEPFGNSQARYLALRLKLQEGLDNFRMQRLGVHGQLLNHLLPQAWPGAGGWKNGRSFVITSAFVER